MEKCLFKYFGKSESGELLSSKKHAIFIKIYSSSILANQSLMSFSILKNMLY